MGYSYSTILWSVISAICGIVFYYFVKLAAKATTNTNTIVYILCAAASMPISLYSIYTLLVDKKNSIVFIALLIRGLNIGILYAMDVIAFGKEFKWKTVGGILLALLGAYLTD